MSFHRSFVESGPTAGRGCPDEFGDCLDLGSFEAISKLFHDTFFRGIDFHCNVMDREYRIVWHNRVEPESRSPGVFCHEFYQKREEPCAVCAVRNVFASGKPCLLEREMYDRLPDGQPRWAEIRVYPIRKRGMEVELVVTVGLEMTDRKYGPNSLQRATCHGEEHFQTINDRVRPDNRLIGQSFSPLSAREIEVPRLVAEGHTNSTIASMLCLSPHTVKSHTIHIFNKLGVNDRTAAAILALRLKLI